MSTLRTTLYTALPTKLVNSSSLAWGLALMIAAQAASAAGPPGACGAPATRVHAIQGSGRSSPLLGREGIVVEAVVVGLFPGFPHGLGGFFIQEEDADADGDPATSEGLFVFDGGLAAGLEVGDRVRVRGQVSEFFGLTELSRVTDVVVCPPGGRASAARIRLPVDDPEQWERWEGMRVQLDQTLVATEHRNLGRFGELDFAAGERLWQATQLEPPGSPALAYAARNARHRILVDDGSDALDPEPTPYLDHGDGATLRLGDSLTRLEGVLDFAFGRFRIHPTGPLDFERRGPSRPQLPPKVDGTLRFVAWNVGNHFNGDGHGGGFPTRGPRSPAELERQRAKLVATLVRLDPDIAALVELENDGVGPESALGQLTHALNRHTAGAPYSIIDPGEPALGGHAIAVGILYRPSAATPVGSPAILDSRAHPDFDDARNRPSLAQTFEARATGERLTVVVNHFKSKGSNCDAVGDPNLGDGQGECNATRRRAARALVEWLARGPTGAAEAPVLIAGDLNAYPQEDPVRAIESGGYLDLLTWFGGPDAYSFVFNGEAGQLDYALARADLLPFVGGAGVWHTNTDEPRVFDYRMGNPPGRYAPDPFRASDHDPVLVGLFPDADSDGVTDARDRCPHSTLLETVTLGDCDSGAPERLDETGCSLADHLLDLREDREDRRHHKHRKAGARRDRWVRNASRWLALRSKEGTIARRDRGGILACVARWDGRARENARPWRKARSHSDAAARGRHGGNFGARRSGRSAMHERR